MTAAVSSETVRVRAKMCFVVLQTGNSVQCWRGHVRYNGHWVDTTHQCRLCSSH